MIPTAAIPVPRLNSSPVPMLKSEPILNTSIITPITMAAMLAYFSDTMVLVLVIRHRFLAKADAKSNGCAGLAFENVTVICPKQRLFRYRNKPIFR